jgi:hypothetical protein
MSPEPRALSCQGFRFLSILFLFLCLSRAESDLLESGVKVETLQEPEECSQRAKDNDFLTLHFTSRWEQGEVITTTHDRGVPVEIQLGTKMLSPGLDQGLNRMCVGEKRRITMPADLGVTQPNEVEAQDSERKIVYDVELMSVSDQTTGNTFKYLDLNGDNKISADEAQSLVQMFMKALSTDIPGIDVKQLVTFFMSLHDRDGDSFISEREFLDSVVQNSQALNDLVEDKDEL